MWIIPEMGWQSDAGWEGGREVGAMWWTAPDIYVDVNLTHATYLNIVAEHGFIAVPWWHNLQDLKDLIQMTSINQI